MIAALFCPSFSQCAELELGLGVNSPVRDYGSNPWSIQVPEADLPTFTLSCFKGSAAEGYQFGLFLGRITASTISGKYTETSFGVGWHRPVAEAGLFSLRLGVGAGLSFVTRGEGRATFSLIPEIDVVVKIAESFAVLFGVEGRYYVAADGFRTYPFVSGETFTVGFRLALK